ncbi:unnamed protein product [Schistosoma curassoni]|uniref:Uncharacterized protein n=1 Tax=Schistosoma curassoni TaxID=6186 RepID=A0A183L4Z8_9TREM|nr:unnamed protein product [Schistosoma curassoni]
MTLDCCSWGFRREITLDKILTPEVIKCDTLVPNTHELKKEFNVESSC